MDDVPRNFREVALILREIKDDVSELKSSHQKIFGIVIGSLLCPLLVGGIIAYFFAK